MLILLFSGCQTSDSMDSEDVPVIHIDSKDILKGARLSELITDVKFVPLETSDTCLIGWLDKIEFSNEDIIALDARKARAIYRFSKEGKFMNQVARQGEAPGEYVVLEDISVNPNHANEIAISDQTGKLLFYNPNNTFLRELRLENFAYKIGWYDHRIATYNNSKSTDLTLIEDETGKEIDTFFNNTDYAIKMALEYPFQLNKNKELLYLTHLDYTIYKIAGDEVNPHVRFTFDKPMFTEKDLALIQEDPYNMYKFISIRYYNENSSHICMVYIFGQAGYMTIHDKSNSKTTTIELGDVNNDLFFTKFMPVVMAVDPNGYFVSQFNYNQVSNPEEFKKNAGILSTNLDAMSNPILMFFKFK